MALDWRIFLLGGGVALVAAYTIYTTATAPTPPVASAPQPAASTAAASASVAAEATPEASPTQARMFEASTPSGRVETYVEGDFQGDRLQGANWTMYRRLVTWPTEPSWDQAYVLRSYRIESGKIGEKQAESIVTYDTLGELDLEQFKYTASPTKQSVTFTLEKQQGEWLIAFPTMRPHVSLEAAIAHLERMAVGYPLKKPAIEECLKALRAEQQRVGAQK